MTKPVDMERVGRARDIHRRLMELPRPKGLSNNEWAREAQVNTSFFTNLMKGSEPSVGKLRAVLVVVGSSIPEFFADEAEGRLVRMPTEQTLKSAISEALSDDATTTFVATCVARTIRGPAIERSQTTSPS